MPDRAHGYRAPIANPTSTIPPRYRRAARRTLLRAAVGAVPGSVALLATKRPGAGAVVVGSAAAALAVEAPLVGLATVPAAVLVRRWRRGPTSIDPASLTLGATTAAASLLVFPRTQERPARGVAVADRRTVEPSADGAGLVVVANPDSGGGGAVDTIEEIATALPGAEIRRAEGDDLKDVLAAAAAGCRSLGIVGGDGSVNAAARAALDHGVPLVVFPGGTLNHFARDLGLDSITDSVDAVREGMVVAIDVGVIADRVFVNNASIGSYSALVDERERLERRVGKWPAMVIALARVLHRGTRFDVLLDGEARCVWMVFFGNSEYEPAGFAPSTRPDLVDGLLDVRLVDASRPFSRLRLILALLLGTLARSHVYERRTVASISVCSDAVAGPVRLAADGETFDGPAEFLVEKRPAALLVHLVERPDLLDNGCQ